MEIIFSVIGLLSILFFYRGSGKTKSVLFILLPWSVILLALSYQGFFENTESMPPRVIGVLIPNIFMVIFFFKKTKGAQVALGWLIAIHIFRVPVEVFLHHFFLEGLVPRKMTYVGFNFDILSGISAIIILFLHLKGKLTKRIFKIWNYCALVLLTIVVVTAIFSAPSPFQLMSFDQPNIAILRFPYILLPGIMVPLVLLSHLLMLREVNTSGMQN